MRISDWSSDVCSSDLVAGTEAAFADIMNRTARQIGVTNTVFTNYNGWPDPAEHVTAHDLSITAERTTGDFPELYRELYGQKEITSGKPMGEGAAIPQSTRHPLLGRCAGAAGWKPDHTKAAGK